MVGVIGETPKMSEPFNALNREFLTSQQLVDRYNGVVNIKTLSTWRYRKQGPAYTKIGGKVMYPLDEVVRWEKQRSRGGPQPNDE